MNPFVLYLLFAKATLTSFSGGTSMPIVYRDFVEDRHLLTERQLNAAIVVGRAVPGPNGLYMVSIGYQLAGVPGAIAGWCALITPPFLMIPLLTFVGARAHLPRVKRAIRFVMLAAAGLIAASTIPLARDSIESPLLAALALFSFATTAFTKLDTLWIFAISAAIALAGLVLFSH